jgi:hypothetical protein
MTTVISRLYENEAAARAVETRLRYKMLPRNTFRVYADPDDKELLDRLEAAGVEKATAQTYAKRVAGGNAVVVVRTTYKPLGAARIAREALAETTPIDLGDAVEEIRVKDGPDPSPRVMKDHPRFLTMPSYPSDHSPGLMSRSIGLPLLSPRRKRSSAMSGGRFMSRAFWPMPLLKKKRKASSAMSGGRYMSKTFWPVALISKKERRNSVIRDGDYPISRAFGWPLLSGR